MVDDLAGARSLVPGEGDRPEQKLARVARHEGLDQAPAEVALGQLVRQSFELGELGFDVEMRVTAGHGQTLVLVGVARDDERRRWVRVNTSDGPVMYSCPFASRAEEFSLTAKACPDDVLRLIIV